MADANYNDKLKKCEHCGATIAKTCDKCPHCGGSNSRPFYTATWFKALAIVFVGIPCGLAFINGFMDGLTGGSTTNIVEKKVEYTLIDIDKLNDELRQNAARAQSNWMDKNVMFTGEIRSIDSNGKYFTVAGKKFSLIKTFHCSIENDSQRQALMRVNRGDVVGVKGKITGVGDVVGYTIETAEIMSANSINAAAKVNTTNTSASPIRNTTTNTTAKNVKWADALGKYVIGNEYYGCLAHVVAGQTIEQELNDKFTVYEFSYKMANGNTRIIRAVPNGTVLTVVASRDVTAGDKVINVGILNDTKIDIVKDELGQKLWKARLNAKNPNVK